MGSESSVKEEETMRLEKTIPAGKELAWYAWTISDRVTKWFSPEANIDPRVGGAYELFFDPSNHDHMSTKGCKVIDLREKELLQFTWKGPDDFAPTMNRDDALTKVTVTFEAIGDATKVTVEHIGWGEGEEWEKARNWHKVAWTQVLDSLYQVFESGEGVLCCMPSEK